jgi:Carbohydrate esterase, sialic acid-specific acetylesterase
MLGSIARETGGRTFSVIGSAGPTLSEYIRALLAERNAEIPIHYISGCNRILYPLLATVFKVTTKPFILAQVDGDIGLCSRDLPCGIDHCVVHEEDVRALLSRPFGNTSFATGTVFRASGVFRCWQTDLHCNDNEGVKELGVAAFGLTESSVLYMYREATDPENDDIVIDIILKLVGQALRSLSDSSGAECGCQWCPIQCSDFRLMLRLRSYLNRTGAGATAHPCLRSVFRNSADNLCTCRSFDLVILESCIEGDGEGDGTYKCSLDKGNEVCSAASISPDKWDVFLLMGQSNMAGRGEVSEIFSGHVGQEDRCPQDICEDEPSADCGCDGTRLEVCGQSHSPSGNQRHASCLFTCRPGICSSADRVRDSIYRFDPFLNSWLNDA